MEKFVKFLFIIGCFVICFCMGRCSMEEECKEKIEFAELQQRVCESTFNLFKEDFDQFCTERFEKMGC